MTNFIEKNSPPSTYWRAILIIGRNTTSYKFSWQKTLLENHKNKSSIKIEDIALSFASFDLTKKENQLKAFNYTNLQPLWAEENLSKSDKIQKKKNNFEVTGMTQKVY